ncbi:hypothetical protein TURU_011556 [Turdus rufiventris]|nr:hypothetical protein TURU_011556 [Turdus rufiventris]
MAAEWRQDWVPVAPPLSGVYKDKSMPIFSGVKPRNEQATRLADFSGRAKAKPGKNVSKQEYSNSRFWRFKEFYSMS